MIGSIADTNMPGRLSIDCTGCGFQSGAWCADYLRTDWQWISVNTGLESRLGGSWLILEWWARLCMFPLPPDSYVGCFWQMLTLTRAITAYSLEKYPNRSTCVSAILNMWRTCGGFAVGYFQPAWIQRNGLGLVFGIQAIVVSVSVVLTIVPVLLRERRKAGTVGTVGAASTA
jgi:hypothetical protein